MKFDILLEEIFLLELQSYDWRKRDETSLSYGDIYLYRFNTPENEYEVEITYIPNDNSASLIFNVVGGEYDEITNEGVMFSIIKTVLDIAEHFVNKMPVEEFMFEPSKKNDETSLDITDRQRAKFYIRAIKRRFPSAKVSVKNSLINVRL